MSNRFCVTTSIPSGFLLRAAGEFSLVLSITDAPAGDSGVSRERNGALNDNAGVSRFISTALAWMYGVLGSKTEPLGRFVSIISVAFDGLCCRGELSNAGKGNWSPGRAFGGLVSNVHAAGLDVGESKITPVGLR